MYKHILIYLLIAPIFGFSQQSETHIDRVADKVQQAHDGGQQFEQVEMFKPLSTSETASMKRAMTSVKDAVFFDFVGATDLRRKAGQGQNISLQLPNGDRSAALTLDLVMVDLYSSDFVSNVDVSAGQHYRGVVRGSEGSLVSLSVFDDEVIGFVSVEGQSRSLGRVKGQGRRHVLYNELSQGWDLERTCGAEGKEPSYLPRDIEGASQNRAPNDCVKQKLEFDESMATRLGGVTQATNYATGIFNAQQTLYSNDGINIVLSELKIWSPADPAPYVISEFETLDSYQALTGAFNGDVAYLGFYQNGWEGGVAAEIGGICQNDPDLSKAIGGHVGTYHSLPTYSYDVLIICHEVGHLFGARHTHACVWNGNNTAIDGCSGFVEGDCSTPSGIPSNPSIMSYCDPVDFNEGFHPQVAQVIRDYVASRTCTSACGDASPTCTDGVQNGDETGVDCGGSCAPCEAEPTCFDGIQNGTETGVDCGGSCAPCQEEPTCFDGIQNGTETGIDCGGSCAPCEEAPTCFDGIQNGTETGVDCGGSCAPCEEEPTCYDGVQNGDETGVDCGGSCAPCEEEPTCDDGIQNGTETGVDCGGEACEPCSSGCEENNITIQIAFDDFAEESSWDITDESGSVVASSGGNYDESDSGTEIQEVVCLIDGCYSFNFYDTYGDGICCDYGDGTFIITDENSEILASFDPFDYSISKEFCIGEPDTDPVDLCEASGEDSYYEWIESVMINDLIVESGNDGGYGDYTSLTAEVELGSDIYIETTPGFSEESYPEYWGIFIDYNGDGDFDDVDEFVGETFGEGTISDFIPLSPVATPGVVALRVVMSYDGQSQACGGFAYGEVEDYSLLILAPQNTLANGSGVVGTKNLGGESSDRELGIYPNPTGGERQVRFDHHVRQEGTVDLQVVDLTGRTMMNESRLVRRGLNTISLDASSLPVGVYLVNLTDAHGQIIEKLIITK